MPIDPSILLSGPMFQMPSRNAIAERALSLAQLTDQRAMQRMQLEQAQRAAQERQALEQVLPDLVSGNFAPEAIQAAVRARPEAGASVLKYADERRKAQFEQEAKQAETYSKMTEAKLKIADKFANEAHWLSEHPLLDDPRVGPKMVSDFQQKIASVGLEKILTTVPFQDWTNPQVARRGLAQAGSMFYDIKDRITAEETARKNKIEQGLNERKFASEDARRKAETAQGWARINQESMGAPQEVLINDKPALASFNRKGGGWFDPATGQRIQGAVSPIKSVEREDARTAKIEAQTQGQAEKISKAMEKDNLTSLVTSVKAVNTTLAKYASGDVPGIGATGMLPQVLLSPEGKTVRSQVKGVGNDLLKLYSGGAVTLNEQQRRAAEMMASGGFSDEDLYNAWPLVVERVNTAIANIRAGHTPEGVKLYESRGGVPLEPMTPAARTKGKKPDADLFQRADAIIGK